MSGGNPTGSPALKWASGIAAILMVAACQAEDPKARQDSPSAAVESDSRKTGTAVTEVRWDGPNAGQLRFDSAACIVMNGAVINFYAPAQAKDGISGQPVLPQANGSKAGDGWMVNIMAANGLVHSGSGEAISATSRSVTIDAKVLDGSPMKRSPVETISSILKIECTEIDDLGTFP